MVRFTEIGHPQVTGKETTMTSTTATAFLKACVSTEELATVVLGVNPRLEEWCSTAASKGFVFTAEELLQTLRNKLGNPSLDPDNAVQAFLNHTQKECLKANTDLTEAEINQLVDVNKESSDSDAQDEEDQELSTTELESVSGGRGAMQRRSKYPGISSAVFSRYLAPSKRSSTSDRISKLNMTEML